MKDACPTLVIAGTTSDVGKTSLVAGLARLLARRGRRVQTFKVGPDFLDPTYLAMASGRTCYNLDGWMTGRQYVRELFARATADADIALVEGVMGLFDGATPSTLEGSTAEIALWLDAPVLLVADAHGASRSLAATVRGFAQFEPQVRVAGVIANQGGSARHRAWLSESLSAAATAPLVGMVPRGALPTLPSRHLGLVAADQARLSAESFDALADACERYIDISVSIDLARPADDTTPRPPVAPESIKPRPLVAPDGVPSDAPTGAPRGPSGTVGRIANPSYKRPVVLGPPSIAAIQRDQRSRLYVRLGIARDEAFHFYYPDNLESLEDIGVEWVPFSPLADTRLPADLDGLYFGGGYPEVHAARLAANAPMLADIRRFAASGRAIYAECGGLMYLGQALTTTDGARYPLAGVLPLETAMLPRLKTLGYAEVAWEADCLWGRRGGAGRGHEFHYSAITASHGEADGWQPAYAVRRRGADPVRQGFRKGRVLAGYVHLHWASRPDMTDHFLSCCKERL